MRYQEIHPIDKELAAALLETNDEEGLVIGVIAVALHESDLNFATLYCLKLASHSNWNIRGNAILGFGHIARRFRHIELDAVVPIVEEGLRDSNKYVRSHAYDAAEDLNHFCGADIEV